MMAARWCGTFALDRLDRQIIHRLQLDAEPPFAGWPTCSRVRADRRAPLPRPQRAGVLRVVAAVDPRALGESDWIVRVLTRAEATMDIALALCRRDDIAWVSIGAGSEIICPPQLRPGRALAHTTGASGSGSPHRSDSRPPQTPRGARPSDLIGRPGTTPPVPGRPTFFPPSRASGPPLRADHLAGRERRPPAAPGRAGQPGPGPPGPLLGTPRRPGQCPGRGPGPGRRPVWVGMAGPPHWYRPLVAAAPRRRPS